MHGLAVGVLAMMAVLALTGPAADAARSSGCADPGSPTLARPLETSAGQLMLSDGTGFFPPELTQAFLQVADPLHPEMAAAAAGVRDVIAAKYGDQLAIRGRAHELEAIGASQVSDRDSAMARLIVIDGDVSVPGEPSVYAIGGARTLYLHWTTAIDDVRGLLDLPEFETVGRAAPSSTAAVAAVCGDEEPGIGRRTSAKLSMTCGTQPKRFRLLRWPTPRPVSAHRCPLRSPRSFWPLAVSSHTDATSSLVSGVPNRSLHRSAPSRSTAAATNHPTRRMTRARTGGT